MKKTILLLLLSIVISGFSQSSPTTPSTTNTVTSINCSELTKLNKTISKIDSTLLQKEINEKQKAVKAQNCTDKKLSFYQKLLIMMPVLFFIALLIFVLKASDKMGFNFKQAFYCEEPETKTTSAPTPENPNATITTTVLDGNGNPLYYLSSSRLIAFLSALTTLIIVVCIMCYYAYCMMKCIPLPELNKILEIFLGLGLGIIPYGINRLTAPTKTT
ncbi:MAG: hypothetical protein ACOVQR_07135 [Flavobacterium sp.]|uniref:hypothetical protein n=1 Tax=Flavobacterium sp. TaxID=239 RepID=UPI003BA5F3AF